MAECGAREAWKSPESPFPKKATASLEEGVEFFYGEDRLVRLLVNRTATLQHAVRLRGGGA